MQLSYLNWRESCCNLARFEGHLSVLTVIPARLGATRLPRKPLRLLGGVPLVVRVYERVKSLNVGDACVVATDEVEVLDVCASHAVPAVLTSNLHRSGTDRVAEVASRAEYLQHQFILNVQGDEPFITRDALNAAVLGVTGGKAGVGTVCVAAADEILKRPDIVKVVRTSDGLALYFSRAPIPYLRDNAELDVLQSLVRQHIGVYAYSRPALMQWVGLQPHPLELVERLEQLRPLAHGIRIAVADVAEAPERGIDTAEDLERANARWHQFESHASHDAFLTLTPTPSTA